MEIVVKDRTVIFDDSMKDIIESRPWHLFWSRWKKSPNYYVKTDFYAKDRRAEGKRAQIPIMMHHLIIGHPLKGYQVDHINGNSLDNRRQNLRIVTARQNGQNKNYHRGEKEKSSTYMGVCWDKNKKKWVANIGVLGERKFLGRYISEIDASFAYQKALKELTYSGLG